MPFEVRVEELIEDIKEKRRQALAAKISPYRRANPILSDISDCDRQMVYSVLNWEDRPLHDEDLQARFDEGKEQEKKVLVELQEMGFEVILNQQPVIIKGRNGETLATGKIDGFVKYKGRRFPLEIKSMDPNVFNQMDTPADFEKKAWLRKYPRQLQMYLFGNNEEQGFFIVTNCMGKWKLFPIFLDFGVCEWILQRLEKIHRHLGDKTYPDRIPWERGICQKCPFAHICLPDIKNEGLNLIEEDHLYALVEERARLKQAHDRFMEVDEEAKFISRVFEKDFILGSDWKIEIRKRLEKRIDTKLIPIEERPKYEVEKEKVLVSFVPLNGAKS